MSATNNTGAPPAAAAHDEVLTVEEAAAFLRIGVSALYDAIGRGEIPHRRVTPRKIRLSRSALMAWLGGSLGVSGET